MTLFLRKCLSSKICSSENSLDCCNFYATFTGLHFLNLFNLPSIAYDILVGMLFVVKELKKVAKQFLGLLFFLFSIILPFQSILKKRILVQPFTKALPIFLHIFQSYLPPLADRSSISHLSLLTFVFFFLK